MTHLLCPAPAGLFSCLPLMSILLMLLSPPMSIMGIGYISIACAIMEVCLSLSCGVAAPYCDGQVFLSSQDCN